VKKLWHIWMAFALCLAVGVTGMGWLTMRAIELDRAEARARAEAARARRKTELQERVAMALWRMDWMLTPLIAQEAARPSFVYQPFLSSPASKGGKGDPQVVASPLLTQPPDYIVLNFDFSVENGWTSPQSPGERNAQRALEAGISAEALGTNRRKLSDLSRSVSFEELLQLLPKQLLPSTSGRMQGAPDASFENANGMAVLNEFGQQQLEQPPGNAPAPQAVQRPARQQQGRTPATSTQPSPPAAQQAATIGQQTIGQQQAAATRRDHAAIQTRDQQEWMRRNLGMQNIARSQRAQMMSNSIFLPQSHWEREGVSRPVWIGSKLILARRVISNGDVRIQGCWLDWPEIKGRLRQEVFDLFPKIDLLPVTNEDTVPAGRLLATLPVQLVVPETTLPAETAAASTAQQSATRISLVVAWCCLLLGAVATAVMLRGVLALSERRASFVSAVTHELRSPLTTFRMYAEMLAEGMVRDEQQRTRYLSTLRQEADRLAHLVENVLQYARLERGRQARRRVTMTMKQLMQQTTERLPDRIRQAGMELHETLAPQDAPTRVKTDPAAVEQILFNLIDNSCKYASSAEDRRIHLHWSVGHRVAHVRVTDHGPGIQAAQARKLFHPFSKSDREAAQSAPGIGLGLALCRRLAQEIGGRLHFDPGDEKGDPGDEKGDPGDEKGAAFLLELPLADHRGKRTRP